jgi:hypothetical protein
MEYGKLAHGRAKMESNGGDAASRSSDASGYAASAIGKEGPGVGLKLMGNVQLLWV